MLELIFSFLGIFFSILFSSLEIALLSSNSFQIDVWSKQGSRLSKVSQKIIGENEIKSNSVILKNMGSGLQKQVPIEKLSDEFK